MNSMLDTLIEQLEQCSKEVFGILLRAKDYYSILQKAKNKAMINRLKPKTPSSK